MKAFQFALEKVLGFRKRQWEAESAALEALLAKRRLFEEAREREVLGRASMECAIRQERHLASDQVARHALVAACGEHNLRKLELALHTLDEKIAEQQRHCLKAKRDYELVGKLREDRWSRWQKECDRELEEQSAEFFLARHRQRRLALSAPASPKPPGVSAEE